ncbi:8706_t:CDS:2 [Entrophospora sp. SA101]|nr:8706_t:CDS:2 [Entrophospora sp. SA101]
MGVALGKQEIEEEMSTQNTLQLISTDQINDELSNEFCKRTYLKCKKCQKPRTGSHDSDLAFDICKNNLRPEFTLHNDNIPPCYVSLMERCLDENPNRRPKLSVIINILEDWLDQLVKKKYNLAERCQKSHQKKINTNHTIHLNAIYTSRLLDYNIEI